MNFLHVRRGAVALALAIIAPALLLAQGASGTVRGKVTDAANGRGLAEAQLIVAGTRVGAISGGNGEYLITGVPSGARSITVRRIGYSPATLPITVASTGCADPTSRSKVKPSHARPVQRTV